MSILTYSTIILGHKFAKINLWDTKNISAESGATECDDGQIITSSFSHSLFEYK